MTSMNKCKAYRRSIEFPPRPQDTDSLRLSLTALPSVFG
jgi:hypothetical protein